MHRQPMGSQIKTFRHILRNVLHVLGAGIPTVQDTFLLRVGVRVQVRNSFQTTEVFGWVFRSGGPVNVDRRGLLESSTSSLQYETPYWSALYSLVIRLKFGSQLRRPTDRPDSDLCMYSLVFTVVAQQVACFWIIGCARCLA